jgi:hypothetical protein
MNRFGLPIRAFGWRSKPGATDDLTRKPAVLVAAVGAVSALALIGVMGFASSFPVVASEVKCTYQEAGQYTGSEDRRIAIMSGGTRCGTAVSVVRTFRSRLRKQHHGSPAPGGWWTMPTQPGWRCIRQGSDGSCSMGRIRIAFEPQTYYSRKRCLNSIPLYGGRAGVAILSWNHVVCRLRYSLAVDSVSGRHWRFRDHRFACHRLDLQAGGGGALCRRGSRFVELGYE